MKRTLDVKKNVQLHAETFGHPDHPAIILIMGAQASMIWWETDFCRMLAEGGRFVIRYDSRDVGKSTFYQPGAPEYGFVDLADDVIGLMDAYDIDKAHLAGMSMGGIVAQMAALRHSERILSLTLISTSNFAEGLPPMEPRMAEFFNDTAGIDLTDKGAAMKLAVDKWRLLGGHDRSFDEERIRKLAELEIDRAASLPSMMNHALLAGGEEYFSLTSTIGQPTLIVHGTDDPIIPLAHGEFLHQTIKDSTFLKLEGAGHELHREDWPAIISSILRLTK